MFPNWTKPTLFRAGTVPETVPVRSLLAVVYKIAPMGNLELASSEPQNSRCGKCCQVLATKTLLRGFVLSQSTFHLVNVFIYLLVLARVCVR